MENKLFKIVTEPCNDAEKFHNKMSEMGFANRSEDCYSKYGWEIDAENRTYKNLSSKGDFRKSEGKIIVLSEIDNIL